MKLNLRRYWWQFLASRHGLGDAITHWFDHEHIDPSDPPAVPEPYEHVAGCRWCEADRTRR